MTNVIKDVSIGQDLLNQKEPEHNILEDIVGMFQHYGDIEKFNVNHSPNSVNIMWGETLLGYDREYMYDFRTNKTIVTRTPRYRNHLKLIYIEEVSRLFAIESELFVESAEILSWSGDKISVPSHTLKNIWTDELHSPTSTDLKKLLKEKCTFFITKNNNLKEID